MSKKFTEPKSHPRTNPAQLQSSNEKHKVSVLPSIYQLQQQSWTPPEKIYKITGSDAISQGFRYTNGTSAGRQAVARSTKHSRMHEMEEPFAGDLTPPGGVGVGAAVEPILGGPLALSLHPIGVHYPPPSKLPGTRRDGTEP